MNMKVIAGVGSVIALVVGLWAIDDRYVKCTDQEAFAEQTQQTMYKLDKRLDRKIIRDDIKEKKKDIYNLKMKYPDPHSRPREISDLLHTMTLDLEKLYDELKEE